MCLRCHLSAILPMAHHPRRRLARVTEDRRTVFPRFHRLARPLCHHSAMPPVRRSSLPTGALWLIGLGFIALLGSLRPFRFLEGEATGGLLLIGLAVFMFLRRQSITGAFAANNSPAARWNLLRASRGAGVVLIVGLLTFLQGVHVIYWESSWPILLIFLGVITLMERVALNNMNAAPMYPGAPRRADTSRTSCRDVFADLNRAKVHAS